MINSSNFIDVKTAREHWISVPKVIAEITLCGALTIEVSEEMDWNPPTPEQIKNLKEILNIDVKLIGETDEP